MINKVDILLMLLWALVGCEPAPSTHGFAGLGSDATGFAQVEPDAEIGYPEALNQHPDFRIEWWYVTANLESESGETLGIQWTLFRQANSPSPQREGWANQQLWLGHVGLTRANQHFSADRYARGGVGQAGVAMDPFTAWIDHWAIQADDQAREFTLTAHTPEFSYDLVLAKVGPPVLQGNQGVSVKSPQGQASYYLSLPFLQVSGSIQIGDETLSVTGEAWLDREWSSQPLAEDQEGWDWFSLHLDQGDKLMLFRLRHRQSQDYFSGTYISADGTAHPLQPNQIRMQPLRQHSVAGRRLPVEWQLSVDDFGIDLRTQALNPNAWMATGIAYWEGPIRFEGSHSGKGYLEMTGY
ncbi:lipocalin-like domain-containing protein [Nitrincola nitratireducens]|uniref:Putative secreted hydrolase n=1 Tax=Nitrincola nitratireducens TaxID=1229521 RepID=W9VPZ1_9GAMM|nr:lipocalin-like domain-containing protein [Nitrincola nitratireducens]EXJ12505.1 putative secreted hydrolase [Nitrincola nitratireducens]